MQHVSISSCTYVLIFNMSYSVCCLCTQLWRMYSLEKKAQQPLTLVWFLQSCAVECTEPCFTLPTVQIQLAFHTLWMTKVLVAMHCESACFQTQGTENMFNKAHVSRFRHSGLDWIQSSSVSYMWALCCSMIWSLLVSKLFPQRVRDAKPKAICCIGIKNNFIHVCQQKYPLRENDLLFGKMNNSLVSLCCLITMSLLFCIFLFIWKKLMATSKQTVPLSLCFH